MITRRAFIRISCLFPFALKLEAREVAEHTVELRDVLMGTFVQMKGVGIDRSVLSDVVAYMKDLERHFTRFHEESELSRFNREGSVRKPSREFREVIGIAKEGHGLTGGVFDVTVLPVLLHFETYRKAPTREEKARYRESMGADRIVLYPDVVYSDRKAQLTLDGVAKGYIIDRGVERLRDAGCLNVLVNIGGDVYCGRKQGGWSVGIYDPLQDVISRKLRRESTAVCTSGSYVNYYTEDRKLHHIVDPATLSSPCEMVSVTVTSKSACRADMLSTTLFVTGPEGKRLLRPDEHAYFITKDGKKIEV